MRPTQQIYSDYTAEDFLVWQTLFERQMPHLREHVCAAYLKALDRVGFRADRIPDFAEVDRVLAPLTGWGIHVVPCISPAQEFFSFLAERKFTATCWLRTMAQLDYIEEPDMFHDVFAHIPLISDPAYCRFLEGLGALAAKYGSDPEILELIGRFYWFTIEFGLIREAAPFFENPYPEKPEGTIRGPFHGEAQNHKQPDPEPSSPVLKSKSISSRVVPSLFF